MHDAGISSVLAKEHDRFNRKLLPLQQNFYIICGTKGQYYQS